MEINDLNEGVLSGIGKLVMAPIKLTGWLGSKAAKPIIKAAKDAKSYNNLYNGFVKWAGDTPQLITDPAALQEYLLQKGYPKFIITEAVNIWKKTFNIRPSQLGLKRDKQGRFLPRDSSTDLDKKDIMNFFKVMFELITAEKDFLGLEDADAFDKDVKRIFGQARKFGVQSPKKTVDAARSVAASSIPADLKDDLAIIGWVVANY